MKKIAYLLTIVLGGSLWAAGDMTVQVISAVHEKSITKELNKKVKKTGLAIHKKVENGRHVVTLGTFNTKAGARKALKKTRSIVTRDAFVRPVVRKQTTATASVTAKTKTASSTKPSTVASVSTAHIDQANIAIAVAPSRQERKEVRKDELSEAIRYYENSPYYRFEPVVLHQ